MQLISTQTVFLLILLVLPIHSLCYPDSSTATSAGKTNSEDIIGPDYRKNGTVPFGRSDGKLASSSGCEVNYTFFEPEGEFSDVVVVLGHGFMRSKQRMDHLAQHLASWGVAVVNVDFCNSRWWAGHHDRNGADMVAVSQQLRAEKTIYVGFSAGGLAALVAADLDRGAVAVFGLDMVDNKGLGKKITPQLSIPFYGLVAPASICNAKNNGLDSYVLAPVSLAVLIEDSSHCHFEFPVDGKCSFFCGKGEKQFTRDEIQETILGLTTAFVLWKSGIAPSAAEWWADGGNHFRRLLQTGHIKSFVKSERKF